MTGNYELIATFTTAIGAEPTWLMEVFDLDAIPSRQLVGCRYRSEIGNVDDVVREVIGGEQPVGRIDTQFRLPDHVRRRLDQADRLRRCPRSTVTSKGPLRSLRDDIWARLTWFGVTRADAHLILEREEQEACL